MKQVRIALFGLACFGVGLSASQSLPTIDAAEDALDERVFEMRTYFPHEGKMDALHQRFREHTNHLFVKHGMDLVGYWVPVDGEERLVYILAHEDQDAAKKSWAGFVADPVWKEAYANSREDGPLVARIENVFMAPTDYSPIR